VDLQELSPYIRFASDSIIPAPWKLNERVLFDYEILYVKEGKIEVIIENTKYIGVPGDIFLIKPKKKHSIQSIAGQNIRQPHIHFDMLYQEDSPDIKISFKPLEQFSNKELNLFREDIFNDSEVNFAEHIRPQNPLIIEKMIFDIIKEFEMKMPFYEINMKGLFIQLFIHLLRENYWAQNPQLFSNMNELYKIQTFLKHNVTRKVQLDELSEMFNISKFHLIRLFKKAFGMGPIQYHQLNRLENAKEKIKFTSTPISEIAEEFGFENIQSFSRAFKKWEGVPPTFYRRTKM
jgi:AraC-like DNA-binding protein